MLLDGCGGEWEHYVCVCIWMVPLIITSTTMFRGLYKGVEVLYSWFYE